MAEKKFTEEEVQKLKENPYVRSVSMKAITYSDEFKEYFVQEYEKGKTPSEILRSAGLEPKILGRERVNSLSKRYRKMASRLEGVQDLRKGRSGRPLKRELTNEEEMQRLRHRVKYLEQENEFLKKIGYIERKARQKSCQKKNTESSKK